jgi:hypothetical protein
VIDERQILALFGREWWGYGGIAPRYRLYRYFEGAFAETVKDADFENRKTSPEDRADGFPGGCVEVLSGFKLLRESSERMVGALMRNRAGKNGLYYLKLIESENRLRR